MPKIIAFDMPTALRIIPSTEYEKTKTGGHIMAEITFKGNPIRSAGSLPAKGTVAPDFSLTDGSLKDVTLADFSGKKKILSIVHSLDTGTCVNSAKRFNEEVSTLDGVVLINISADLPFAAARICESHNLKNIVTLSNFRSPAFGKDYGVLVEGGPIRGLLARSIVVLDDDNKVLYTQQGPELAEEPDYAAALNALR